MRRVPILMTPAPKDYLWGGSRLNDDYKKDIDMFPLAETWECSTHPDGRSLVGGSPLNAILENNPDWLGTHPLRVTGGKQELPILIKLIDAEKDLSVQVHPDDEYAKQFENGSFGKTEMWYVLDAKKDSKLVYGFRNKVTKEQVRTALLNGKIEHYLNHIPVCKNDLFYIEAGTVHAIGKGCLIAEIQESSNLTYRLYDYNRVDKNGCKRPLHIDKALEVANLNSSDEPRQPMRVLKYRNGVASELLCRCKYFQVERVLLNTETQRSLVEYKTSQNSFHALLCVDGCGTIVARDFNLNFFKGDCMFVPADSETLKFHGKSQLLDVSC